MTLAIAAEHCQVERVDRRRLAAAAAAGGGGSAHLAPSRSSDGLLGLWLLYHLPA